jgi:hypothetical protein
MSTPDPMCAEVVWVFTSQYLRERNNTVGSSTGLLATVRRYDGYELDIAFSSIASLGRWLADTAPGTVKVMCGQYENEADIMDALHAAAEGAMH